jgi:transposase
MAKYSYEFKLKVIQEYLNGEGGYKYLCKKYNIPAVQTLAGWVACFQAFGEDGIMRKRKNISYTYEFKLRVVELYLTTEKSYSDLAIQERINNPAMINKWVNNYRIAGPEALKPKRKGRRPKMPKKTKDKTFLKATPTADSEYLKQLEEENLKLRIENAYLKESRRLRLEEELQKKKRELFTASEENLN